LARAAEAGQFELSKTAHHFDGAVSAVAWLTPNDFGIKNGWAQPWNCWNEANAASAHSTSDRCANISSSSGGSHRSLRTLCVDTGPDGDPNPGMVLADLVQPSSDRSGLNASPKQLHAIDDRPPLYKVLDVEPLETTAPDFTVTFTEDKNGFYINGRKFTPDASPMTSARVGTLSTLADCQ
jgi:hypothetical protein